MSNSSPAQLAGVGTAAAAGEEVALELQEWDPEENMREDATVVVVGPRGSGKSTMIIDLLHAVRRKLDYVVGFTNTEDTADDLRAVTPGCFVHCPFEPAELESVVQSQKEQALVRRKDPRLPPRNVGIVLDDCADDKRSNKGKALRTVYLNGRHHEMFSLTALQYATDLNKGLRENVDYAVCFPVPPQNLDGMLNVLQCFHNVTELDAVFNSLQRHEALVFDRRAFQEKRPCLYFYKAKYPTPAYRIGRDDTLWILYYQYFKRQSVRALTDKLVHRGRMLRATEKDAAKPRQDASAGAGAGAGVRKPGGGGTKVVVRRAAKPLMSSAGLPPGAPQPSFVG